MGRVIVIDPGHGGRDPGATGNVVEKVVMLQAAKALDKTLKQRGYRTVMTRSSDNFISLSRRANIANNHKGDLFISLHMNSASNPAANGVETLYHPNSANGKRLAQLIQKRVKKFYRSDRGVKPRGDLYVLRKTSMPAVIVELGFVGDDQDSNSTVQNMSNIVSELVNAIDEYYGKPVVSSDDKNSTQSDKSTDELYRVRSSWDDVKSQEGAYRNLQLAKDVADKFNKKVYDSKGIQIYPTKHWSDEYFDRLDKEGIGFHERRPSDTLTRGEFAAYMVRFLDHINGKK